MLPPPALAQSDIPSSSASAAGVLSPAERYQKARAAHEENRAALSTLEVQKQAGILVDAESMHRAVMETYRRVRERMLSIPDRLSPRLAATSNADEVYDLLTGELESALQLAGEGKVQ